MVEAGLSREEAMKRFVICTSVGAIGKADGKNGDPNAKRGLSEERAAWVNDAVSDGTSLEDVVKEFKPTCLLGLAAQPAGLFTEGMVRGMVEYTDYPIVMPMSNPTAKAEARRSRRTSGQTARRLSQRARPSQTLRCRTAVSLCRRNATICMSSLESDWPPPLPV